jgi:phosphoribosyl-ATP pyrophosphohydrolase
MSDFIDNLLATLQDRKANPKPGSYTNSLLNAGEDEIVKKIGEEAVEIIIAAKGQGDERLVEETADFVYHLLVLLVSRDLTWNDVRAELARRHK